MATPTDSPYAFVNKILGQDESYVLPSIQRPYVWKEKQICKLFDSIMRGYPLGTLLVWKTNQKLSSRPFSKDWSKKAESPLLADETGKAKNLILDGQQRLQSLLIGLRGTYEGKSLFFNILSDPSRGALEEDDGMAYLFKFSLKRPSGPEWVAVSLLAEKMKEVMWTKFGRELAGSHSSLKEHEDVILGNLEVFKHRFQDSNYLSYNLIDEVSNASLVKDPDDIVEIFVRTNNGGTKLDKSDLLFSLLTSRWEPAYANVRELEDLLKAEKFDLGRDYLLKATLLCTGNGAAYQVKKFQREGVLEQVQSEWKSIRKAVIQVISFLKKHTPVKESKQLVSQNSLLPLIAMNHAMKTEKQWSQFDFAAAAEYILRTTLAGSFNGAKDNLLDDLAASMKKGFDIDEVLAILEENNRPILVNEGKIWAISYTQPAKVYFAMSKIVVGSNLEQVCQTNIDHIIAKDLLEDRNPSDVNQLANLTVIDEHENKSKKAQTLTEWLKGCSPRDRAAYCHKHHIPTDETLWAPEKFDDFIKARKALIMSDSGFKSLLVAGSSSADISDQDAEEEG
jgi:hypothetical protein